MLMINECLLRLVSERLQFTQGGPVVGPQPEDDHTEA